MLDRRDFLFTSAAAVGGLYGLKSRWRKRATVLPPSARSESLVPVDITIRGVPSSAGADTYPSVLRTSGQSLVDSNGFVMPRMRGFDIQPVPWPAQTYVDIYNFGGRILRTQVFWDSLEPTQGNISSTYIANLDTHIQRLEAAGLYTTISFYYGPNGVHKPTWVTDSTTGSYATFGQNATQYLAKRYGAPSDPAGTGQYTSAVIGFGLNEPTPNSAATTYMAQHMADQKWGMTWARSFAPNWIGIISAAYGGGCPLPNVTGSGQTTQTFTGAAADPFSGMGNWMMDLHAYFIATTSTHTVPFGAYDGRNTLGAPNWQTSTGTGGPMIGTDNPYVAAGWNYTTYPLLVNSVTLTRIECQQALAAFLASHVAYCAPGYANVPLMIGEWGWVPKDGTTSFTGQAAFAADRAAGFAAAHTVIECEWDYNVSQTSDKWSARPGSAAAGADANGWQTATNAWMTA